MPTLRNIELTVSEKSQYVSLEEKSQIDYVLHRNAGMSHTGALALVNPDMAFPKFEKTFNDLLIEIKGGQGSGNYGHGGRPGERGGSGSGDGAIVGTDSPMAEESKNLLASYERHLKDNKVSAKEIEGMKNASVRMGEVIASHENSKEVRPEHLAEAIQYAEMDRTGDDSQNQIRPDALFDTRASGIEVYDRMDSLGISDHLDKELPKLRDEIRSQVKDLDEKGKDLLKLGVKELVVPDSERKGALGSKELKIVNNILADAKKEAGNDKVEAGHLAVAFQRIAQNKGGAGSGNFGHAGREGERGGSSSDGGLSPAERGEQNYRDFVSTFYRGANEAELKEALQAYRDPKSPQNEAWQNFKDGKLAPENVVVMGVAGGQSTRYPIKEEKLSNGNTLKYKMTEDGTHYSAEYPDALVDKMQTARASGARLRFESGDMLTGKSWGDVESGRIGRSTGTMKIPLIIKTGRSSGGGALGSIVNVSYANAKEGGTVWKHETYKPPKDGFNYINKAKDEIEAEKGGAGSGNFGHTGRPGELGGSQGSGSPASEQTADNKIPIAVDGKAEVSKPVFDRLWDKYHAKDYFGLQNNPEREAMGIKYTPEYLQGMKDKTYAFMRTRMTEMSEGKLPPQREKLSWELYRDLQRGINKGGSGSGNFGHAGRPGERGGSSGEGDAGAGAKPEAGAEAKPAEGSKPATGSEADIQSQLKDAVAKDLGKDVADTFDPNGGAFGTGSFEDGKATYNVIDSEDEAIKLAEDQVREDLRDDPSNFNQDWLQGHIDTEHLADELRSDVEDQNRSYFEDIKDESGDKYQNRQIDELVEGGHLDEADVQDAEGNLLEDDKLDEDKISEAVDKAVEAKTEEQLSDPVGYLEEIYGKDDALKEAIRIGGIDEDKAVEDAVSTDGWAHFLSRYDGNYETLSNGAVYYIEDTKRMKRNKISPVLVRGKSRNIMKAGGAFKRKPCKRGVQKEVTEGEKGLTIVKFDDSKRLVYGVFLYPNEPDHDGDVISPEDIETVAHGFMKNYREIDEMHDKVIDADIVESAIAWKDGLDFCGKILNKGAWFGVVHVADDKVWAKVKSGLYKGFSVRISGTREVITEAKE